MILIEFTDVNPIDHEYNTKLYKTPALIIFFFSIGMKKAMQCHLWDDYKMSTYDKAENSVGRVENG